MTKRISAIRSPNNFKPPLNTAEAELIDSRFPGSGCKNFTGLAMKCPDSEVLMLLARSTDRRVRQAVASNTKATDETRVKLRLVLREDPDVHVRRLAFMSRDEAMQFQKETIAISGVITDARAAVAQASRQYVRKDGSRQRIPILGLPME